MKKIDVFQLVASIILLVWSLTGSIDLFAEIPNWLSYARGVMLIVLVVLYIILIIRLIKQNKKKD